MEFEWNGINKLPNLDIAISDYKVLESKLKTKSPEVFNEADELANNVIDPSKEPIEKVWRILWEKPLYSNTRVETADKWIAKLEPYMKNSLNTWGEQEDLLITKKGNSGKNIDFTFEGNLKSEIKSLSIAYKRLYSIQCAAISLRKQMLNNPYPLSYLRDNMLDLNYPFERNMKTIMNFGYGWAAITTLHSMTDLGCGVKPDLHLCRTIHHLGICPEIPKGVEAPKTKQCILINKACLGFLSELQKRFPEEDYKLRSLDKVLMEISRIGNLPN